MYTRMAFTCRWGCKMERYIIYDVDGICVHYGKVDKSMPPDGTTVFESVKRKLKEDATYKILYLPVETQFNRKTQKVKDGAIVGKDPLVIAKEKAAVDAMDYLHKDVLNLFDVVVAMSEKMNFTDDRVEIWKNKLIAIKD